MLITANIPKERGLGLHVHFVYSLTDKFTLDKKPDGPYRWNVTIGLPECKRKYWYNYINLLLHMAQQGHTWAIRMEYDNAFQFLDLQMFRDLAERHKDTAFYLYGAPGYLCGEILSDPNRFRHLEQRIQRETSKRSKLPKAQ